MSDATSPTKDESDIDPPEPVCTGAPERIWLVVGDLDQDCKFDDLDEVTWCSDQVCNQDIEYVRADTVTDLRASLRREENARKVLADENMRLLKELRAMHDQVRIR
jgi:hypothetical protein